MPLGELAGLALVGLFFLGLLGAEVVELIDRKRGSARRSRQDSTR